MKTRISRLLVWISILLITVLCFASCDALQGAISKGMLNKEKLIDGKTPKDLYGSSINKYKNKKDDGLPYRIEAEWYSVSAPNALTKAEIVYIGDDFYCGIWDSSDDKIESEAITFKNNNMYHVAKDGSKHKNK